MAVKKSLKKIKKNVWFLYILECSDGSLYAGITKNIARRIKQHSSGKGSRILRGKLPVKLVYQETHSDRSSALKREIQIKKLSRNEKMSLVW